MRKELLLLLLCCFHHPLSAQYSSLSEKDFAARAVYFDSVSRLHADEREQDTASEQLYNDIIAYADAHNAKRLSEQAKLERFKMLLTPVYKEQNHQYEANIKDFLQLLHLLKERKNKKLYAYALSIYADHLEDLHNFTEAFEQRLKAHDIYTDYSYAEYPYKAEDLFLLGRAYYRFENYEDAITCYKESFSVDTNSEFRMTMTNDLALSYRYLEMWDSAYHYFNVLHDQAVKSGNEEWQLIAELNIAHTYNLSGDEKRAYEAFTTAHRRAKELDIDFAVAECTSILADIEYVRKNYRRAKELVNEGLTAYNGNPYWYYQYKIDAQKLFGVASDIYAVEGNYRLAYLYKDSMQMVKDSTARTVNIAEAASSKHKLLLDKYVTEKENARQAQEKQKQTRNATILATFLMFAVTILFTNRQRVRRKQLQAEKDATESKLNASRQQLQNYTRNLQEKNKLIEQFTEEVEKYKTASDRDDRNETLQQLQRSTILTDEDWVEFRQMFEQVHSGYLQRLREKIPDLTPGEVRFMVLSKLKLSTKEMANILGVGMSTIRKYRHQVRNKLGLPEDGDTHEVADTI